jgi:hypothetical protein
MKIGETPSERAVLRGLCESDSSGQKKDQGRRREFSAFSVFRSNCQARAVPGNTHGPPSSGRLRRRFEDGCERIGQRRAESAPGFPFGKTQKRTPH